MSCRHFGIALSVGCYLVALALPAYYFSLPAIDGYRTYSGFECLLAPLTEGPIVFLLHPSWLANPLFAISLTWFCRKQDAAALGLGSVACLLASLFLIEASDPYNHPFRLGFWCWLASLLVVVSAAGIALVYGESRRGMRRAM